MAIKIKEIVDFESEINIHIFKYMWEESQQRINIIIFVLLYFCIPEFNLKAFYITFFIFN